MTVKEKVSINLTSSAGELLPHIAYVETNWVSNWCSCPGSKLFLKSRGAFIRGLDHTRASNHRNLEARFYRFLNFIVSRTILSMKLEGAMTLLAYLPMTRISKRISSYYLIIFFVQLVKIAESIFWRMTNNKQWGANLIDHVAFEWPANNFNLRCHVYNTRSSLLTHNLKEVCWLGL